MSYTGLHQHSKYSVLDGLGDLEKIVLRCKELGMEGVCVTDHGNCFAWYELNRLCKKHDMKPIFANEMYFTPNGAHVKEKIEGYKPAYHLIVIAKNDIGFKNLMRLTSKSWLEGKYYKPRVDWTMLREYGEGLVVIAACLGGYPQQLFMEGRLEEAEDAALRFKKIFGDRYFLELQDTGIKEQKVVNDFFREISKKHDIPYVITSDAHYVNKEDSDYHGALVAINVGGKFKKATSENDQDETGLYYTPHEYYIKSFEEISPRFSEDLHAFGLTNEIAKSCNVNFVDSGDYLPKMAETPEKEKEILLDMCFGGLASKGLLDRSEYQERLHEEIETIYKMGYCGYFIIVSDYINWAKENKIMTGPGRGSAAGSLVSYLTGITKIDPIEYNLLFSRFLNKGRAKYPLVDFEEYSFARWKQEQQ